MTARRIRETVEYISRQLSRFRGFRELESSKEDFFTCIEEFKLETLGQLSSSRVVDTLDLEKLRSLLDDILEQRSKENGPRGVYWNGVKGSYYATIALMSGLMSRAVSEHVPLHLQIVDSIRAHPWAFLSALLAFLGVLLMCF